MGCIVPKYIINIYINYIDINKITNKHKNNKRDYSISKSSSENKDLSLIESISVKLTTSKIIDIKIDNKSKSLNDMILLYYTQNYFIPDLFEIILYIKRVVIRGLSFINAESCIRLGRCRS